MQTLRRCIVLICFDLSALVWEFDILVKIYMITLELSSDSLFKLKSDRLVGNLWINFSMCYDLCIRIKRGTNDKKK